MLRWKPDQVVLLPLYPQYSTTTTGSSLEHWHRVAKAKGLSQATTAICCYPVDKGMIKAQAGLLQKALKQQQEEAPNQPLRVLFSAHGLPKKIIEKGDPYQFQVEMTAKAIVEALEPRISDWKICYQSRVGPMEWIGPSTEAEIHRAGTEGKGLVILPIAFVSEHSETLVELDIEYAHLAKSANVPSYTRVPALGTSVDFIDGLSDLVLRTLVSKNNIFSGDGNKVCGNGFVRCAKK